MSIRIRSLLLDKVQNYSADVKQKLEKLNNINISYKHGANLFTVSLENKQQINKTLKPNPDVTFELDRNIFISKVINNFKDNILPEKVQPKNVVVDFSSPNVAKPFHVGHLRSTIIGNFIANINAYYGNNVTKLNYLGDWGTQFGLLQYGLKLKNIDLNDLSKDPIRNLYNIYVEMNELSSRDENVQREARKYFTDIERGENNVENWTEIRKITIAEFERVYNRLGIKFDEYHWESDYNHKSIQNVIEKLDNLKILLNDDTGKKIAIVNNKKVTLLKSDNSTLYMTRDIAALLHRYEKFKFEKMLYVVDNAQTDHFVALFDIVSRINKECVTGCEHIKFGRIKGMSTRKGNVIFLNDILEEAKQKMFDKQQQSKSK